MKLTNQHIEAPSPLQTLAFFQPIIAKLPSSGISWSVDTTENTTSFRIWFD